MEKNKFMIGSILKEKRLEKGLDREAAAKKIGISKQMLGHLETNYSKPTFQTLTAMSEVYGCTIGELCGENQTVVDSYKNDNYIDTVIQMLTNDGTLKDDIKSFDDLDEASKKMMLAALNKYMLSSIKNKNSSH